MTIREALDNCYKHLDLDQEISSILISDGPAFVTPKRQPMPWYKKLEIAGTILWVFALIVLLTSFFIHH